MANIENYDNINPSYDAEYCYECSGYGDDVYTDEDGELQIRCTECPFSLDYGEENY